MARSGEVPGQRRHGPRCGIARPSGEPGAAGTLSGRGDSQQAAGALTPRLRWVKPRAIDYRICLPGHFANFILSIGPVLYRQQVDDGPGAMWGNETDTI